MKKVFLCLMACMMFASAAMAESVTLEGAVVSTRTVAVLAPAEGTLDELLVQAGDRVEIGQTVASLMGTKVYAAEDGTVHIFGNVGDSVDSLSDRYGAVAFIEPDVCYTTTASTKYAYDADENKIIHPGETIYLKCISECAHTGVGIVTLVDGTNFRIEVTEGTFKKGETVRVFRSSSFDGTSRLGKGSISKASPIAYTGSGTVTNIYAEDGAHVTRGTLLYETVDTDAFSDQITSTVGGVVTSVAISAGDAVDKGALLVEIYPDDAMRLMVEADEYDLRKLSVGSTVSIEFVSGVKAEGTVERISGVQQTAETTENEEESTDEDEDTLFAVYIEFQAEQSVSYGMTAKITTSNAN